MEAVINLKFDEEPKYAAMSALFEPLCGPSARRPISTDGAKKVGMKRKATDKGNLEEDDKGAAKRRLELVFQRNGGLLFTTRTDQ